MPDSVYRAKNGIRGRGNSMDILGQLAAWSLIAFGLLLFATQAAAREIGYWLGQRHNALRGTGDAEGVGLITTGMIGLLGFVLALMLSFSSTRFDERRQGTLDEANAIGTAWLRAEALGHSSGSQVATLLKDYIAVRREYIQADRVPSELREINQRSTRLQQDIWSELTKVVRERPDPAVVSLMSALNEVFDKATSERFAHDNRIPESLFWLLMALAHLSMGAIGYQLGLKGQRSHVLASLLTAVWTAVIVVILDLSAPRLGAIRTSVDVYDWVLEDMNGPAHEKPK